MNMIKKLFSLLALSILVTSCTSTPISRKEEKLFQNEKNSLEKRIAFQTPLDNKIKFGVVEIPENLNPFYSKDESSKIITNLLYQKLFSIKRSHSVESYDFLLAEDFKASEDGKTYTLVLKDDLYWHNGEKITTDDVVYSIEYTYKNKDTVYLDSFLIGEEEITFNKLSDKILEFQLPKPSFTFKYDLENLKVVPSKTFSKSPKVFTFDNKEFLIGSGAYVFNEKIKDEYFNVNEFNFVAFDKYFDGKAHIDKLSIKNVAHYESTRYDLLDYNIQGGYLPGTDLSAFEDEFYNTFTLDKGNVVSILFKMKNPTVKDKKTRDAISNLINYHSIMGMFGDNTNVSRANSIFGHDNLYTYQENLINEISFEKSVDYLKKLQLEDENFELKLGFILNPGETHEKFAVYLQERFIDNGINIKLIPLYEEEYLEEVKNPNSKAFDFCLFLYESNKNPDHFSNYFKSDGILNYSGYENKSLDNLWEEAKETKDFQRRTELYGNIQEILYEDKPIYPIVYSNKILVIDDRIINIEDANYSPSSFFYQLNRLDIKEFKPNEKDLKKYKIDPSKIEKEPKFDNVNIYSSNSQPKKLEKPKN
ncbi:MAG: ABC transporter substrate-binding protein [Lagierella massiliensis]|nr:ABC transporter substrate-binding protein [Lagierella massiliensis]